MFFQSALICKVGVLMCVVNAVPLSRVPPARHTDATAMPMRGFVEGDLGITDWQKVGQDELADKLTERPNTQAAKNVIVFVGDGMGVSTVTAARIYHAQSRQLMGYDASLAWESMPHTGVLRTYIADYQTPDSGSTGTALLGGEKTRVRLVGLNQHAILANCSSAKGNEVKSVLKYAIDAGKDTGIVTTARITHATPATAYAHSAERAWEADSDMPQSQRDCPDIARQLIEDEHAQKIKVLLGGGRRSFHPIGSPDPEYSQFEGHREDGRDLIKEWIEQKINTGTADDLIKYVRNTKEFEEVSDKTNYLLGLFEPSHMQLELVRKNTEGSEWSEPSLAQMTDKAIRLLQKSENGFFLLVEGGNIDFCHHGNQALCALNETTALSDAVRVAQNLTSPDDTLLIVTADHSHAFSIQGYPFINNNILGLVRDTSNITGDPTELDDGKPYTTLTYGNGAGYLFHRCLTFLQSKYRGIPEDLQEKLAHASVEDISSKSLSRNLLNEICKGLAGHERKDLTTEDVGGAVDNSDYFYDSGLPRILATHSGEDVAVYASGPWSHLVSGTHEQNYIAHILNHAACMGDGKQCH